MKRVLSLAAALALVAFLVPATAGTALAWTAPTVAPVCAHDGEWQITLAAGESDYRVDVSTTASFASVVTIPLVAGVNLIGGNPAVAQIWVRWSADHSSIGTADRSACPTPSPVVSPTVVPSTAPTATPSETPTVAPSNAPTAGPTEGIPAPTPTPGFACPPGTIEAGVQGCVFVTLPPTSTDPGSSGDAGSGLSGPVLLVALGLVLVAFGLAAVYSAVRK